MGGERKVLSSCDRAIEVSLTVNAWGLLGMDITHMGTAMLMKDERKECSCRWPCTSLYSSRHISPATAAVVVAMAGMIRPAMSLL